jgi:glycosyltransferase involved in cell wall biosynthesis
LAEFAKQYCQDVRVVPTVVDTEKYHNRIKIHYPDKVVIGWTGTFTNFGNLELILPVIRDLQQKFDFTFKIIADKDPGYSEIAYEYRPWTHQTEIDDLLSFSIGIMPLKHEEMEKGKCAFKAIQYMSLGIPAVASPVGANVTLIQDGINGFLADTNEDWFKCLEKLLQHTALRNQIGAEARRHIEQYYSVKSTIQSFCNLFKS